jgi:flagellin
VATFTTGGKDYNVTLTSDATDQAHYAPNVATAIAVINQQLVGSGVKAIADQGGNISFQSSNSFTIAEGFTAGATSDTAVFTGSLFGATNGNVAVTAADSATSATGNALNAINSITAALAALGVVQGKVGAGENQLNYGISLAQSQITNFDSAQSQIRDTDVAAEAANLSKAQVLQQASIAAMAQANSAPQQVLALLRQ